MLVAALGLVAFLYAMVGHGGASGYIAVLSMFLEHPIDIATTALYLNVMVSVIAFIQYAWRGFFSWQLSWPWLLLAVPFALLGGMLTLPGMFYSGLLAVVLIYCAWQLWQPGQPTASSEKEVAPKKWMYILAPLIGFISGITGVGGGIFLSPLLILSGWVQPKNTAATSALFIFVNSLAGLTGRYFVSGDWPPFPPAAFFVACLIGSVAGAYLGASKMRPIWLNQCLALVLLIAAVKMLLKILS